MPLLASQHSIRQSCQTITRQVTRTLRPADAPAALAGPKPQVSGEIYPGW